MHFQTLSVNEQGNDFFIGDIHGAFDELSEHLNHIHFNPKTDRLICVGDLLDRGQDSFQALDWLQRPYVFSVRGNHEEMYLQWQNLKKNERKAYEMDFYFPNGGEWVQQHTEEEHRLLAQCIQELPYMLIVPNRLGKNIGVVHAGLPDGAAWPEFSNTPITQSSSRDMLWSTDRLFSHLGQSSKHIFDEGIIPGLDAVVCGHIKVAEPIWAGNFLYLETQGWKDTGHFSSFSFDEILKKRVFKH